jgi:hypothetical protein
LLHCADANVVMSSSKLAPAMATKHRDNMTDERSRRPLRSRRFLAITSGVRWRSRISSPASLARLSRRTKRFVPTCALLLHEVVPKVLLGRKRVMRATAQREIRCMRPYSGRLAPLGGETTRRGAEHKR